jgi:hypothetical protein
MLTFVPKVEAKNKVLSKWDSLGLELQLSG